MNKYAVNNIGVVKMDNNMANEIMEMLKQMKTEMNQRFDKME